jgi:hypothetical protein
MTFEVAAQIATSIGVVFVLVSILISMNATRREKREARSEFCMREVLDAWKQAYELLADGNNKRTTWILASRILAKAEKMKANVTVQSHQDVIDIAEVQYRNLVADLLGGYQSDKRGSFYYGIRNFETVDIDEACGLSTQGRDIKAIDESSLYTIWEFAQFPDDYEDPLEKGRFSDEWLDSGISSVSWPGVHDYISHIRRYR